MSGRRRTVRVGGLLLALATALTGCTYATQEPGLFGRQPPHATRPPVTPAPSVRPPVRPVSEPLLPVAGEATWTSGDGLDITVRLAVHAVRRVAGATVLDWSVTPLSGPGLGPDDPVPASLILGLSRYGEGNTNAFLLDQDGRHLYRPLARRDPGNPGCLCTPIYRVQQSLRLGRTTLLQTAFPELPAGTDAVDVDLVSVPIFYDVAVTARGQAPETTIRSTLTRPLPQASPDGQGRPVGTGFRYAGTGQRYLVSVLGVSTAPTFTSVSWEIRSLDAGDGLDGAVVPPLADAAPPTHPYNLAVAAGPVLEVPGLAEPLRVRWVSTRYLGTDQQECLCSPLRLWAESLRSEGAAVVVVTNFAPLPRRTATVSVSFPGLGDIADITPVGARSGRSAGARTAAVRSGTWSVTDGSALVGWPAEAWPTPVPDPDQLADYRAVVEDLRR